MATRTVVAILPTELFGILFFLHHFVKEPFAALCHVQNLLENHLREEWSGWRFPVLVAYCDCIAYHLRYVAVVFHQDLNHLSGRHYAAIIIFYGRLPKTIPYLIHHSLHYHIRDT